MKHTITAFLIFLSTQSVFSEVCDISFHERTKTYSLILKQAHQSRTMIQSLSMDEILKHRNSLVINHTCSVDSAKECKIIFLHNQNFIGRKNSNHKYEQFTPSGYAINPYVTQMEQLIKANICLPSVARDETGNPVYQPELFIRQ